MSRNRNRTPRRSIHKAVDMMREKHIGTKSDQKSRPEAKPVAKKPKRLPKHQRIKLEMIRSRENQEKLANQNNDLFQNVPLAARQPANQRVGPQSTRPLQHGAPRSAADGQITDLCMPLMWDR